MRHLLSIEQLDRGQIESVLAAAESFDEIAGRDIKKVPTLRGRTVVSAFFEPSTRTSSSFELASKRLSADLISLKSSGSSAEKGEALVDTVLTVAGYDPAAIVIRHPSAGAARLVADHTSASVINAGDGRHEHPTQALLDIFALRKRVGSLEGMKVWIVGDVLHSRVARSNLVAFRRMGAEVTVCGPPTLIPREIEAAGFAVEHSLDRVSEADVVYALRLQHERMRGQFIPSVAEYARSFQIDARRLSRRQLVMHPGPVNRGVELEGSLVESPQSLIADQVSAGLTVRMAVLYELVAGGDEDDRAGSTGDGAGAVPSRGEPA